MDNKTWLWRKRSAEKTILATDKVDISPNHTDQEVQKQSIAEVLTKKKAAKNLNDKLAAVLIDNPTDKNANLVQEVTNGQEKAKPEAASADVKKELEKTLRESVVLNAKLAHLDAELKKCTQQLNFLKEEQEQMIHDAVIKASNDLANAQQTSATVAEITQLRQTLLVKEKLVEDLNKRKYERDAEFHALMARLDCTEKENTFLKYEFRALEKELEIQNDELEYSRRSADVARKQQLDSVKKITELEAECQRLHALMRKKLPSPKSDVKYQGRDRPDMRSRKTNPSRDLIIRDSTMETSREFPSKELRLLIEQLKWVEDENRSLKDLMKKKNIELDFSRLTCSRSQADAQLKELSTELARCSPMSKQFSVISNLDNRSDDGFSSSASWANSEFGNSRANKFKHQSEWKSIEVSDMSLMDDFVEMEKLAIVSADGLNPRVAAKAHFDWLQVVLSAIVEQKCISNQSSQELVEDIRIALGLTNGRTVSLNKSIGLIVQLIDEIGAASSANSKAVDNKCIETEQSYSPQTPRDEYFVHVFQWKHSELSVVLQRFVSVCNDLLKGKADMETFAAELSFSLDWILNNHTTLNDASRTRDKIKKHFGWNEQRSETSIELPVKMRTNQDNMQEENERLKDELKNMKVKWELAAGKNEDLMLQLQELELSFGSLQKELKTLKASNELIEDENENQKSINEDLDTELTVTKSKLNEIFQKFSSLEVELEYKNSCCEELEVACLDLQLQQKSFAETETPNYGGSQDGKPSPSGWEISEASAKLAECQKTILNQGKQLKALASPREAPLFEKVLSTNSNTESNIKKLKKRYSLRDQMLPQDGYKVEVPNPKEVLSNKDAKPQLLESNDSNTAEAYQNSTSMALVRVPSKKQGGVGFLRKLVLRKKKGSTKKG